MPRGLNDPYEPKVRTLKIPHWFIGLCMLLLCVLTYTSVGSWRNAATETFAETYFESQRASIAASR